MWEGLRLGIVLIFAHVINFMKQSWIGSRLNTFPFDEIARTKLAKIKISTINYC